MNVIRKAIMEFNETNVFKASYDLNLNVWNTNWGPGHARLEVWKVG